MSLESEVAHRGTHAQTWYLEGCDSDGKPCVIQLEQFPFHIGRQDGCNLRLSSSAVSRRHAKLFKYQDSICIQEFGSTNGTFVNRQRINGSQILHSGDVIHIGDQEFRIVCLDNPDSVSAHTPSLDSTICMEVADFHKGFIGYAIELEQMLRQRAVVPHYQSIVQLRDDKRLVGYELLGRCCFPGLPESPGPLFEIAQRLGRDIELSKLFRETGIEQARSLETGVEIYFNTLPAETDLKQLEQFLPTIRRLAPELAMTMEIHETAVTNIPLMRDIRSLLNELNMKLAYDDFGAGHARLLELMEVPPEVLKFDIALIRDIHLRPAQSRKMIKALVQIATDLGIKTLAEGIEISDEFDACREIGFDYAQGYFTGRPAPLHQVSNRLQEDVDIQHKS